MPRSSARLALVAAACLALSGCAAAGELQSLVTAKAHDERATAACTGGFPEGLVTADNLVVAKDSTVASVRKLATAYKAGDDATLADADAEEYAAICVISGELNRGGTKTSNLAVYVLDGAERRGELAAF